jgi:glycosyltransferase involved in cell wall biosynthesis
VVRGLVDSGLSVTVIPIAPRAYLTERRKVAEVLRSLKPSLVHSHGYRVDVLDAPVARRLGIPTVTTLHGFTAGGRANRFYEYLQIRACRQFDAVVSVSGPIRDRLVEAGVPRGRVHLIRNAWAADRPALERGPAREALGLPHSGTCIGWVGRLSREKGPDILIRAVAALGERDLWVSIVGEGPDRGYLERLAASLGVSSRIRWHGLVPNASQLYRAFDVFALSSRTEGTPIVLFEAIAAGVPVVATRVGGVPDVVSEAEAMLVDPEDPAALARAIAAILHDAGAATARARVAASVLKSRFALGPWLQRHERLYASLTSS